MATSKREPWWVRFKVKEKLDDVDALLREADHIAATLPDDHQVPLRMTIDGARGALKEVRARYGHRPLSFRVAVALLDACEQIDSAAKLHGWGAEAFARLASAHCSLGMARVLAFDASKPRGNGPRQKDKLLALAAEHPGLSPGQLNKLMKAPLDAREARRIVNRSRGR